MAIQAQKTKRTLGVIPSTPATGGRYTSTRQPGGGFSNVFVPQTVIDQARGAQVKPPPAPRAPYQWTPDAAYNAAVARLAFNRDEGIRQIDERQGYANADFAEASRRLGLQRTGAEKQTRETANRQGLFYSGQLGKRLGDVAASFTRQQGDLQRNKDRDDAARRAARQALIDGYTLEEAAARAEAVARGLARYEAGA